MDQILPPHFHKTDRISEADLVPNGAYVSVVPDWPAPEGTQVLYLNGTDFRVYRMIDGVWRFTAQIDPGSVPQLLASASLGSAGTILDTGDFAAHKYLTFDIFFTTPAVGVIPAVQFNGDTAANYSWQTEGTGGTTNLGAQTASQIAKPGGTTVNPFYATGRIYNPETDYKSGMGESLENGGAGGLAGAWTFHVAWDNNTDQITSIQLLANNGVNTLPVGTTINVYGHD